MAFWVERKRPRGFSRNFEVPQEIPLGGVFEILAHLLDHTWQCGRELRFDLKSGDEVVGVYQIDETNESIAEKVWTGMTTAYARVH